MVLGITGGIASGKSSVARLFGGLGAVVVSADELARRVVSPGSATCAALVDRFGREILREDGSIDRERLGALVFADPVAREDLNRMTHPAIARLAEETLSELRSAGHQLIVYEAPLLFEAAAESRVDRVLVVSVEPGIQLERLMARDKIGSEAAQAKIDAQMPLPEKVRRADYLVDNSGPPAETAAQVERVYRDLLSLTPA